MSALLEFDGLEVSYRTSSGLVPVVRGVDLALQPGRKLGLAGESGCGKTTLANTVLRLEPANAAVAGRVLIRGRDVRTMSWGQLRSVRWAQASVVFQGALHSLNPVRTIADQIAEPMRLHDTVGRGAPMRARVADLLIQVGLPENKAAAYPHQLSGGQKQRVMIAMALACRPDLIIADEPTTALDVMVQAQILDLIGELAEQMGIGLVMISHDLAVLRRVCDDIAVMYAGKVVESGPASTVFDDPQHPYTAALVRAFPSIGDPTARYAPRGLKGDPPDPARRPPGCPFAPRCDVATSECAEEEPVLRSTASGTSAACIRLKEVATP
jgi:peptide/nickel transport system ATP-binding protein